MIRTLPLLLLLGCAAASGPPPADDATARATDPACGVRTDDWCAAPAGDPVRRAPGRGRVPRRRALPRDALSRRIGGRAHARRQWILEQLPRRGLCLARAGEGRRREQRSASDPYCVGLLKPSRSSTSFGTVVATKTPPVKAGSNAFARQRCARDSVHKRRAWVRRAVPFFPLGVLPFTLGLQHAAQHHDRSRGPMDTQALRDKVRTLLVELESGGASDAELRASSKRWTATCTRCSRARTPTPRRK